MENYLGEVVIMAGCLPLLQEGKSFLLVVKGYLVSANGVHVLVEILPLLVLRDKKVLKRC